MPCKNYKINFKYRSIFFVNHMRERGNVGEALMLACQNHPQTVTQASCAADFQKVPNGGCSVPCASRLDCGHVCRMMCHPIDPEHKEYECQKPCIRKPCTLNHKCPKRCYQECGPCKEPLEKTLPLCGHLQKVPCYKCDDLSIVKCQTPCVKTWPCGHEIKTKCHVDPQHTPCKIPCGATLNCGHLCDGTCGSCLSGRVHVSCKARCDRTLLCGHNCTKSCATNCPPCRQNCSNYCRHRKCKKKCDEPCDPCLAKCIWQCQHHECTKLCRQLCNRPRCDVPCTTPLPCGHSCIGLCGEICPKKCRECDKDEVTEIFFGTEGEPDARFVELSDCGHMFEVRMMDEWMDQAETTPDGKPVDFQLKLCPKCRVPIRTSLRYSNIVKTILADFERVKQKILLDKIRRDQKVAMLKGKVEEIGEFPEDQGKIKEMLNYASLTDERINVIDNQIRFLSFLQPLKVNMGYFEADELFHETKEDLKSKVEQLRKRVMRFWFSFSVQDLEELNEEMYRTQLLIDFRMLKMQLDIRGIKLGVTDTVMVDFVKEAFDSEKSIDKKRREQYRARIERIKREQGLQEPYQAVRREEKDLIVKTMGFPQGQWFKCPNGHIYCITECGGAMEESKCPECGSRIGGHYYRTGRNLSAS